ncbi:MAG: hypothetical protein AVDCRST_MAG64-966 [uncultured Phycisphaerae bacterium]|uniref:Uncharacterized protein n=1 Tax=uncultured Phycisphaerae bacterium TaxID=904963 RepID=A0A6J4NFD0_9BACT|nr:MAG: hypothetical protein AVDCRST_MAG64-966 [uncultured Phycisphaerae bacterium]
MTRRLVLAAMCFSCIAGFAWAVMVLLLGAFTVLNEVYWFRWSIAVCYAALSLLIAAPGAVVSWLAMRYVQHRREVVEGRQGFPVLPPQ